MYDIDVVFVLWHARLSFVFSSETHLMIDMYTSTVIYIEIKAQNMGTNH